MDDGALQALVAVLQTDHALYVSRRRLLRGQAERDLSLREQLAALRREVAQNFPLRINGSKLSAITSDKKKENQIKMIITFSSSCSETSMTMSDTFCSYTINQKSAAVPVSGACVAMRRGQYGDRSST